jgi:hypothetical protein
MINNRPEEHAMSLILRIVFIIVGLITGLFVARDALHFELVQTWMSIAFVIVVVSVGSIWLMRGKA